MSKNYLVYVAYGDDPLFYDGIKISILSLYAHTPKVQLPKIVVIGEKDDEFYEFPVTNILPSNKQKDEWTLHGLYHYITCLCTWFRSIS